MLYGEVEDQKHKLSYPIKRSRAVPKERFHPNLEIFLPAEGGKSQSIKSEDPEAPPIVRHFRSDTRPPYPEAGGSTDFGVHQARSLGTALSLRASAWKRGKKRGG